MASQDKEDFCQDQEFSVVRARDNNQEVLVSSWPCQGCIVRLINQSALDRRQSVGITVQGAGCSAEY